MSEKTQRVLTYITLLAIVETVLFLIGDRLPLLPPWAFYPLLILACFRVGRALSFNGVFVWLRDACKVKATPDSSGAGDSNNPCGKGPMYVIGELLCCPICSATWGGAGLLLVLALDQGLGNAMIMLLGAAGGAEVLHWLSERLEWSGRYYREEAGSHWLAKNGVERMTPEVEAVLEELNTPLNMDHYWDAVRCLRELSPSLAATAVNYDNGDGVVTFEPELLTPEDWETLEERGILLDE